MLKLLLLPFRLAKVLLFTVLAFLLLIPFYGFTMETYHGMKAAHARAQKRMSVRERGGAVRPRN